MTILKALLISGNDTAWLLPWCTLRGGWFRVRGDRSNKSFLLSAATF